MFVMPCIIFIFRIHFFFHEAINPHINWLAVIGIPRIALAP